MTDSRVQIIVDHDTCCGNLECAAIAPELFGSGDDGLAIVLQQRLGKSSPLIAKLEEAIRACPVAAIRKS